MDSLKVFRQQYKSSLRQLIKQWASYRKSKEAAHLNAFMVSCNELSQQTATYRLFALQQLLASISSSAKKAGQQQKTVKEVIKEIDWLMNQLIRANQQSDDPFLKEEDCDLDSLGNQISAHQSRLNRVNKPNIVIIDDQQSIAESLASSLRDFAFNTHYFLSIEDFKKSEEALNTDLVLLDVVMPNVSAQDVFEFAAELFEQGTKVISCSSQFTFESRLLAVRANVCDYAVKPVNTYVLVEKIGRALQLQQQRNYHIVIVDDQETMGAFYKSMLEQLGCKVTFFSSAKQLFKTLDDIRPDMFLLDMMMPDVDGLEVAKMLRQEQKLDFAPILFITGDEQVETRLAAIAAGADDVINKSSAIKTITSQVITRLDRASQVKAFVAKDPLTGVLNHGQIVESANHVIKTSVRRKTTSSLAVIDVDHFKRVNDTYGHVAGDKVLCALGQLLANSVRETDAVGRYGGEEFVLVFEDCPIDDAASKVQMIKDIFSSMSFSDGAKFQKQSNFQVTFSAGVVELSKFENVMPAIASADKALYRAKEEGRNKVIKYKLNHQ